MKWVKVTLPPASGNCHIFQLFFYEIQTSIAAPEKVTKSSSKKFILSKPIPVHSQQ